MKSRKARAMSAKRGLSARNSRVSPCTLSAPSSTSRCGFRYTWKCRGLMLRLRISTQRSEEHTSELQSQSNLVCRLLLEKKKKKKIDNQQENYHEIDYVVWMK